MKYANGNASTAQVAVTAAAIQTVRQITPPERPALEDLAEVVEVPRVDDLPGERVDAPERVDEERRERGDVDQRHPGHGRQRARASRAQPAVTPERQRQAAAGPPQGGPAADGVRRYEITSFQAVTHFE